MKVDFQYERPLNDIVTEVLRMENILEANQEILMKGIGKEIRKEVEKLLPKSDSTDDGYVSGGFYQHMRDDVRVTVNGKRSKTGITGVTVHGGNDTAYKWHLLDDGTRNPDGSIHTPATHFTSKAMQAATPVIEQMIDIMERKVTQE